MDNFSLDRKTPGARCLMIPAARHTKRVRFSGEFGSFRSLHHGPWEEKSCTWAHASSYFWRSLWNYGVSTSVDAAPGARYHAGTYPQVIHKLYTLGSLGVCAVDHGPQLKVLDPSLIQPGH